VSEPEPGPVAIVTGAARGLGLGIVGELLAAGWRVCGVDINADLSDALAAAAESDPSRVLAVVADVSTESGCQEVVRQAWQTFGRIDALVNNAGVGGPSTTVHETDPDDFTQVIGVNLIGPFHMTRAAVPRIIEGGRGGAVVNIGSILGQCAEAGSGAYAASKAGLAQLGQAMALELGPHGIRVNTVAPGYMLTAMHEEYMTELATTTGRAYEETVESLRSSVPLGRHGTPEDVGHVVAWLLSDRASYVTGQTIGVNGGILLT
jgi:3-oxoacyl-[acyl-carrier protein] reductase